MTVARQEIVDYAALRDARAASNRDGGVWVVRIGPGFAEAIEEDSYIEKRHPDLMDALSDYERILDERIAAKKGRG